MYPLFCCYEKEEYINKNIKYTIVNVKPCPKIYLKFLNKDDVKQSRNWEGLNLEDVLFADII